MDRDRDKNEDKDKDKDKNWRRNGWRDGFDRSSHPTQPMPCARAGKKRIRIYKWKGKERKGKGGKKGGFLFDGDDENDEVDEVMSKYA